jgi:hypothetical protein
MSLRHLMTTRQVAEKNGVTVGTVSRWCREGAIFPIILINGIWMIEPFHRVNKNKGKVGAGRPPGSRNRRPYPKGVKRPRKPKPDAAV